MLVAKAFKLSSVGLIFELHKFPFPFPLKAQLPPTFQRSSGSFAVKTTPWSVHSLMVINEPLINILCCARPGVFLSVMQ